ncbi:shikimate dehydrogenase [Terriglobus albidus]|uniref:shikimate dehydrogenase n=1 Tax=Terriglobus albidus TaxID=1592106 RepID=UPI0021E0BD4C|nr:shikimate dehydrogenase [Terriglobus albidus]
MTSSSPNLALQSLRSRLGRVCVALQGASPAELFQKAEAAAPEHMFLEFRLDSLPNPAAALPRLKEFLEANPLVTAITTCRRKPNGGGFTGSLSDEAEILAKAAAAGSQLIDLEIESAEAMKHADLDKLRAAGAAIIISYHDFEATRDLDAVYERIQKFQPDFIKVVPTARSLADNLTLFAFLEKYGEAGNVIGISMGEYGVISRVLGVRAGSAFTFAASSVEDATAPGQIPARALVENYRIDHIAAGTKIYGVAGNPVRSSLSPLMLNTAFRRETVNAVYLALQTSKLTDLLKVVQAVPIHGLSVTMPLKQEILEHLERTDPLSAKIGAVNTIVRAQDGKLYGFNTDVGGIVGPIERRRSIRGLKVLVLGAGGASRAAVFGLKEKGADVTIYNRTVETAQKLAKQAGAKTIKRELIGKTHFDLIINSTPAGMKGNKLTHILEPNEMHADLVFDLVYNPVETPFLRMAREKGIPVITGVEMFVHQGARQFEIWTGKPAPEEEMLRVVVHALKQLQAEAQASAVTKDEAKHVEAPKPAVVKAEHKPEHKPEPAKAPPVKASVTAPVIKKPVATAAPVKEKAPEKKAPMAVKKSAVKTVPTKPAAKTPAKVVAKAPVKKAVTKPAPAKAASKSAKKAVAKAPTKAAKKK